MMVANIFSMGSAWPSQRRLASLVGLVGEALLTDHILNTIHFEGVSLELYIYIYIYDLGKPI